MKQYLLIFLLSIFLLEAMCYQDNELRARRQKRFLPIFNPLNWLKWLLNKLRGGEVLVSGSAVGKNIKMGEVKVGDDTSTGIQVSEGSVINGVVGAKLFGR